MCTGLFDMCAVPHYGREHEFSREQVPEKQRFQDCQSVSFVGLFWIGIHLF